MPYEICFQLVKQWVDFHWEVNGQTLDFSLPGGGFVSFTDLVEVLGIAKQDVQEDFSGEVDAASNLTAQDFVKNIANVEFSDESLVKVVQIMEDITALELKEQLGVEPSYSSDLTDAEIAERLAQKFTAPDWVLVSLLRFDSEETLTVTMKDGNQWTIRVTDASYIKVDNPVLEDLSGTYLFKNNRSNKLFGTDEFEHDKKIKGFKLADAITGDTVENDSNDNVWTIRKVADPSVYMFSTVKNGKTYYLKQAKKWNDNVGNLALTENILEAARFAVGKKDDGSVYFQTRYSDAPSSIQNKYLSYLETEGMIATYNNGQTTADDARTFTLYKKQNSNPGTGSVPTPEQPIEEKISVDPVKQIDYLGDDGKDSDDFTDVREKTGNESEKNDLYRIYLDATMNRYPTNANVVFVADYSTSMRQERADLGNTSRYKIMQEVLSGEDGIIKRVLGDDNGNGNLMTYIKFSDNKTHVLADGKHTGKGSDVLVDWTKDATAILDAVKQPFPTELTNPYDFNKEEEKDAANKWYNEHDESYWTDYEVALHLITQQLDNLPEERKDNPTYVIFLSDGLPTSYLDKNGEEAGGYEYYGYDENPSVDVQWQSNYPIQKQDIPRWKLDGQEVVENLNIVLPETYNAIKEFLNVYKNVVIDTIGFGGNAGDDLIHASTAFPNPPYVSSNENHPRTYSSDYTYSTLLRKLGRNGYASATDKESLSNILENLFKYKDITVMEIKDDLSDYVEFYAKDPDFAVTKKTKNGQTEIMYIDPETNKVYSNKTKDIYIGQITWDKDHKEVKLIFDPNLAYEDGDKYTLSFNVEASSKAYADYSKNLQDGDGTGYNGVTGQDKTDFGNNSTSSKVPGFFSNEEATVTYNYDGTQKTEEYPKPVIQVGATSLEIEKVWQRADGTKTAPNGTQEVLIKLFAQKPGETSKSQIMNPDHNDGYFVISESSDWKLKIENLNPKVLVNPVSADSKYEPIVYTVEEVNPPKGFTPSYVFTRTESKNTTEFTNINNRYEPTGNHIYEISEQSGGYGKIINTEENTTTSINIKKVDEKTKALPGAVFTLQKKENGSYKNIKDIKNDKDVLAYSEVEGIDSDSQFTSGASVQTIYNLPDGEYKLVENSAPDGYVITLKEIEFKIEKQKVVGSDKPGKVTFDNNTAMIIIVNEPGVALPNTGGPGTRIFTILGSILILGAGVLLWRRRRYI